MATYTARALHTIRSMWAVFLVICLMAGCTGFGTVYVIGRAPPVVLTGLKEVDGVSVRDGALDMVFSLVRSRSCTTQVDRWLWQDSGRRDAMGRVVRRYVTLPPASNPPSQLGVPTTYILSIPLPSNVGPGSWFYWSRSVDDCGILPMLDRTPRESPNSPVLVTETSRNATPGLEQLIPEPLTPQPLTPR